VYSGYWDEINIWSSRGVVIGKIKDTWSSRIYSSKTIKIKGYFK
jgi:hypothetical protein